MSLKNKSLTLRYLLVATLTAGLLGFVLYYVSRAGTASIYLQPAATTIAQNATFNVAVRVNTNGDTANAVQANLSYPASQLEVIGVDYAGSAFDIQAEETLASGSIRLARGANSASTGDLLFATITFRMLAPSGQMAVDFASGTAVVRSTDNQDITGTLVGGVYTAASTPTADTVAPTAPSSLAAANVTNNSVSLRWSQSSDNVGVVGYKIYQSQRKTSVLMATTGDVNSVVLTGLTANTRYSFYVTAIDAAGNESARSNKLGVKTSR
jgi:hypothetical protein